MDAVRRVDPGATVAVDLGAERLTVQTGTAPASRIARTIAKTIAAVGCAAEPLAA